MNLGTGWASPALDDEKFARLTAIEAGIPGYMRQPVTAWMTDVVRIDYKGDQWIELLALAMKVEIPKQQRRFETFMAKWEDSLLVTALDWFLYHNDYAAARSNDLKTILDVGRSEWKVTAFEDGSPRMTRRIPHGVEEFTASIVERTGAAGSLLAEAFNAVYGSHPNPDHAYGLSVKAVETLACPKFLPSSTRATLGAVYAHLERKDVHLPLRDANAPDKELVVAMMRKLFLGAERHGSETYEHVSLEGAKTALSLAAALLSMLHEDVIVVS